MPLILKGEGAQGMDLVFASLLAHAGDEPDAMYGRAAKSVQGSAGELNLSFYGCGPKPASTTARS